MVNNFEFYTNTKKNERSMLMNREINIIYKTINTFANDIVICRKIAANEYYDCNENKNIIVKGSFCKNYEGYIVVNGTKYPYADRFIESFYYLYNITGMSEKTSILREQYLSHLINYEPSKKIKILLFNNICIYAGKDIVKPKIDKIYRRFMSLYPNANTTINYNDFNSSISCSYTHDVITHNLDIKYNILRGEFLAYESAFSGEVLLSCERVTR